MWVSKGELDILQAFSQFLPRVLEQSLFDSVTPNLNGGTANVFFNHVRFDESTLGLYDYKLSGAKPIDIFDIDTGE